MLRARWPRVALPIVVAATLLIGPYAAWRVWPERFSRGERLTLQAEALELSPQPAWIHGDLKTEIIRDGSLQGLSLLDPLVTVTVARACALNPWVAEVTRVTKRAPGRIAVELTYRRPIALVEVLNEGERGLLPVDAAGTVLPTDRFFAEQDQTRNFLRIAAGYALPTGTLGRPWGDPRIVSAAKLAAALEPVWARLGLYRIVASNESGAESQPDRPQFELHTRDGAHVLWGHAPDEETPGEQRLATKLERLAELAQRHGSLDQAGPAPIDVRTPRTALRP